MSIKRSSVIKSALEKASSRLSIPRTLAIDVCTRWNSTLHMIESFIASKPVIRKFFDDMPSMGLPRKQMAKLEKLKLTSSDWTWLKILAQLLKPFDLATKLLSSPTYPTIGLLYSHCTTSRCFLRTLKAIRSVEEIETPSTINDDEIHRQWKRVTSNHSRKSYNKHQLYLSEATHCRNKTPFNAQVLRPVGRSGSSRSWASDDKKRTEKLWTMLKIEATNLLPLLRKNDLKTGSGKNEKNVSESETTHESF